MQLIFKKRIPILISHSLCKIIGKILLGKNIGAFTFFPFIVVRDKEILKQEDYIRHETIHLTQYIETLFFGLLVIGLLEYLYARIWLKKSKAEAYYYTAHEQEAHQHDQECEYLKGRKFLSYYHYILPKNKKKIAQLEGKRIIT